MENKKCEACGGEMKKLNEVEMKCESCGATMKIENTETTDEAK